MSSPIIISCMSANYVARELNYRMTDGWMQGQHAAEDWFRPINTYRGRLDDLLLEIQALGFSAFDLWSGHLHPDWATPEHIAIARDLIARHGLRVVSLAGSFGDTREAFTRSCALAKALDVTILGGGCELLATDRAWVVSALREHGLKLAIENHPEKTPADLLARMGVGDEDVIGAAVDTGWFGTQGYDAEQALRELRARLFHVHLKDVRKAGAHNTCRYGEGVVPINGCVHALKEFGYAGAISVEHEPETFDPTMDVRASYRMLKQWLSV